MPSLVTNTGFVLTTFPTQTVEAIDYLSAPGGWVAVPHLYCDKLVRALNAYDMAELSFEVGAGVVQPGQTAFATFTPLTIRGKFVRITISTPTEGDIVWVGYVPMVDMNRDAVKDVGGNNRLVGNTQGFTAVGLEYFLDRIQIDSAIVYEDQRILRPLVFNGGASSDLDPDLADRGNRKVLPLGGVSYQFTDDPTAGVLWSAEDIVVNLLAWHTMRNSAGNLAPTEFVLDVGAVFGEFLAHFYPTLNPEGMTVFQCLNKLIQPQRGLSWWIEFIDNVPTSHQARIHVASHANIAVNLPGGGSLPANDNQQSLDFDGELDVTSCLVGQDGSRVYHQVVVRSARMTCTLTAGVQDGTLVKDWTDANETAYKAGASADADYNDPGVSQADRNDAMRQSEEFYRVYSAFRIPFDWDGLSGDGISAEKGIALPVIGDDGLIDSQQAQNPQGLRLLSQTRLKRGWDYEDPENPIGVELAESLPQFTPPFALLKVTYGPDRYQYADHMHASNFSVGTAVGDTSELTSYHLYMQQTVPGIRLQSAAGLPHTLALDHWAGAEPSNVTPQVSYDSLLLTCTVEADAFCEAKWPTFGFPANTPLEILTIYLDADDYRLDFLARNTVVGLRNGVPVRALVANVLRDDRPFLADVARMAYEWYRVDRKKLTVSFKQIRNLFELGMLITTIGDGTTMETINTLISVLEFNLRTGVTTVKTADDDLDLRSIVA